MMRSTVVTLLALALAAPGFGAAEATKKVKRPSLEVRASPRMAFSPVNVFFTAELTGGDDVEELYCPQVEWEWGDGGKSVQESDCAPYEAGTRIERRFTNEHEYGRAGQYGIKVTLRHNGKSLAANTVQITVRPGVGDRTIEPN
jgi:hypothetical protein